MVYEFFENQAELKENPIKIVEVVGKKTLLADLGGTYFALANKCTHAGGFLENGSMDGTCLRCPAIGPCSICGPASRWRGKRAN